MKWKAFVWWAIVWGGLLWFFRSFGLFSLLQQEEAQAFLPEWASVRDVLTAPGGFCTVAAQFLVQFYPALWPALLINASLVCAIGVFFYILLQRIAPRTYNLLLALIPVVALASVILNSSYVLDGTIGLFLMLLLLCLFSPVKSVRLQLILCLAGSFFVFFLIGQLAVLFGVLLVAVCFFCKKNNWYYYLLLLLFVSVFSYVGFRMGLYIPLTDGIYSERYQMSQLQPDSFVYYIWIRYSVMLLVLFLFARLLSFLRLKRWTKWLLDAAMVAVVLIFCFLNRPDKMESYMQTVGRISYYEQNGKWDDILRLYERKTLNDYVDLNYLNMALAQRGELGDKMFGYNQKGPQSLLVEWDRTYFVSALLSDIHYIIGDISVSESYAMDGLTLAKRGGSPRMLKRLAEINFAKGDYRVAKKYVDILSRMPLYRRWAEDFRTKLENDSVTVRQMEAKTSDNLLCLMSIDSLWRMHLSEPSFNRIAFDYLGCSYLLSKELSKFESFLGYADSLHVEYSSLPVHFQEAILLLSVEKPSVLERYAVSQNIVQRFKDFQSDAGKVRNNSELLMLKQRYGDTFWFYFYYKKL